MARTRKSKPLEKPRRSRPRRGRRVVESDEDIAGSRQPSLDEMSDDDIASWAAEALLTPLSGTATAADYDSHANLLEVGIPNIISEIQSVPASAWEAYKPKLVALLASVDIQVSVPRVSLDPDIAKIPPSCLKEALRNSPEETAKIPTAAWDSYKQKLIEFSESSDVLSMDFLQRLEKISQILYLPEELETMRTGDWARLEAATVLCAMLARTTSWKEEPEAEEWINQWYRLKMRDQGFLKNVFALKKGFAGIKAEIYGNTEE
ncbi:hypothetical protein B0I35DRAFT_436586 [Stachybotrys elegans]|uniref:Uncharacterized protein n=1 Tax=Stachybotrys elegans TaxID=80388 RepID=A0A8K0SMX9_9HYPO|nr:hypothetical protein B0I35DRAFT_436586 [Stachybotrys elegans]